MWFPFLHSGSWILSCVLLPEFLGRIFKQSTMTYQPRIMLQLAFFSWHCPLCPRVHCQPLNLDWLQGSWRRKKSSGLERGSRNPMNWSSDQTKSMDVRFFFWNHVIGKACLTDCSSSWRFYGRCGFNIWEYSSNYSYDISYWGLIHLSRGFVWRTHRSKMYMMYHHPNRPNRFKQLVSLRSVFQVCAALFRFASKDSWCWRRLPCCKRSKKKTWICQKHTERSAGTMSGEMQPWVHQFQDSPLDVTSVMQLMEVMEPKFQHIPIFCQKTCCQLPFLCRQSIDLPKRDEMNMISRSHSLKAGYFHQSVVVICSFKPNWWMCQRFED